MKTKLMIPSSCDENTARDYIYNDEKLQSELNGKTIKKLIIVPNRLINIIV